MIENKKLHMLSKELLSLSKQIENQLSSTTESTLLSESLFYDKLRDEIIRADRYKLPFSLCMISPDNYTAQPDAQLMPENIFNILAGQIGSFIRPSDYLGRNKKSALSLLLPMTRKEGAVKVAKRLCNEIANLWEVDHLEPGNRPVISKEELQFLLNGKANISKKESPYLTISIGIVTYPDNTKEEAIIYKLAEKLLRVAMKKGGNRVESSRQRKRYVHLIPPTVETLLTIESLLLSSDITKTIERRDRETFKLLKERFKPLLSNGGKELHCRSILKEDEYKIFEKLVKLWLKEDRRCKKERRQKIITINMDKRKIERRMTQNLKL